MFLFICDFFPPLSYNVFHFVRIYFKLVNYTLLIDRVSLYICSYFLQGILLFLFGVQGCCSVKHQRSRQWQTLCRPSCCPYCLQACQTLHFSRGHDRLLIQIPLNGRHIYCLLQSIYHSWTSHLGLVGTENQKTYQQLPFHGRLQEYR